ncbi:splicing factor, CC1-like protein [Melanomma pulvis-pyrius CBS 109.77]|uniref:Splicing factor, CC1-like protein n=1 Tax=Melanomma pulvis-pyrius CBS 109.77 TaxID=1314802 RepID=A0A6A6X2B1_9PLEO|nr:splicing factor, CC1-like protein [Melanomma pulvis-pyrius CBS 109.77]
MPEAMKVDALLEEAAKEMEEKEKKQAAINRNSHSGDDTARGTDTRDRDHDRDRTRDRARDRRLSDMPPRDRGRDRDRHRPYRESNSVERNKSRERRRKEGSQSNKDADTDDAEDRYDRRHDRSRERARGGRGDRDVRLGDFYSGGGRARSRSPRRDGDRYRAGRDHVRDRSRDRRRAEGDRRGSGRRNATPPEEPTEDDRDKRTIFVQQISARAETRHLRQFFEVVGPVVEAQIVKDRVTGRSKGVGYVEFKEEPSVAKAIEMTGQKLKGVPIIAQLAEAEKNRASRVSEVAAASGGNGVPFHRLFVGNIHFSVSEEDLTEIFEPFGELEMVTLQRDKENPGNRSKGYGAVQYVDPADAKKALTDMNGFELAGRQIRVGLGSDKFTPESTATLLRNFNAQAQSYQGSAFSGAGGRGAHAGGTGGVFDRANGRDDRGVSGASALDDSDIAGVNFNTYSRDKLMNALARNHNVEEPVKTRQPLHRPRVPVIDKPQPSKCIKIQNAFDADNELKQFGVNWAKDLEQEVKVECNTKYGKVVHIAVDPNTDGDIYVKFETAIGGEKALQGLNGRSFNFRTIRASYVVDKIYNSLYAAAAKF